MLTLYRRVILILFGGLVIIGSSLLLPHVLSNDQLLSRSMKNNSTSFFNTSSQNLSAPINNNASSTGFTKNQTHDYLLILRQGQTRPRKVFLH